MLRHRLASLVVQSGAVSLREVDFAPRDFGDILNSDFLFNPRWDCDAEVSNRCLVMIFQSVHVFSPVLISGTPYAPLRAGYRLRG